MSIYERRFSSRIKLNSFHVDISNKFSFLISMSFFFFFMEKERFELSRIRLKSDDWKYLFSYFFEIR